MEVNLLTSSDHLRDMELNAAVAALTCHANTGKEFKKFGPRQVLERIIKAGHESVLEHINLTYSVKGLSRACLQELARHRHISLSVESTRHTLKKNATIEFVNENFPYASGDFGMAYLQWVEAMHFVNFAKGHPTITNDELKYYLPECWPTNLVLTSNVRELRHIVKLRTAPAALKEFQDLARKLFEAVPDEFRYLLEDCVYKAEDRGDTPKNNSEKE